MASTRRPTPAELEILRVLWERGPSTVREVQECLESFAKVQQAQVRVITDPLGGPMVVASVVVMGKGGPTVAEEIIDHCAKNLAPYKVPRRIEFCETLPIA